MTESKPLLELSPKFIFKHQFTSSLIVSCLGIFVTIVLLIIILLPIRFLDYKVIVIALVLTFLCTLILSFLFLITSETKKAIYQKTNFKFFNDRVFFSSSFINHYNKEIAYDRITEIHLNRSILQKFFNLGTLVILTSATEFESGIKMVDIENPNKCYTELKKLIWNYKNKNKL